MNPGVISFKFHFIDKQASHVGRDVRGELEVPKMELCLYRLNCKIEKLIVYAYFQTGTTQNKYRWTA